MLVDKRPQLLVSPMGGGVTVGRVYMTGSQTSRFLVPSFSHIHAKHHNRNDAYYLFGAPVMQGVGGIQQSSRRRTSSPGARSAEEEVQLGGGSHIAAPRVLSGDQPPPQSKP